MRQSFLLNIVLLIGINLLIKPLYLFGIEIPLQNIVGHESYGIYFVFLNLTYLCQLLADLGVQNYNQVQLSDDRERISGLLSGGLHIKAYLSCLFVLVTLSIGYVLGYMWLDGTLFFIVVFNMVLISLFQFFRAHVSGLGLYLQDSLLSALDKLLLIAVMVYFIYFYDQPIDMHDFAWAQLATLTLSIGIGVLVLHRRWIFHRPRMIDIVQHIKRAIPFGWIIALMFLYTRLDAIMIEALMTDGAYQSGLYASAYRLYDMAVMFLYLFAGLLLPMFARSRGDQKSVSTLYHGSLSLNVLLAVFVVVIAIKYADEIMYLLYDETTDYAILTFQLLFLALIFKGSTFITTSYLTANERIRSMSILFAMTILINIGLNYWWINVYGIEGAALATALTHVFVAIGCIVLCHHGDGVRWSWRPYIDALLTCLGGLGLYFVLPGSLLSTSGLVFILSIALGWIGIYYLIHKQMIYQLSRNLFRPN